MIQPDAPLWYPKNPNATALGRLQAEKNLDYWSLHKWSIENPGEFWSKAWDDLGLIGDKGSKFFESGASFIDAKFFPEGQINVAENLLKHDEGIAIISILEDGSKQSLSFKELRAQSAACAAAMRASGIQAGDRVVAWAPNVPEVMIFALGALSIGAIVSTASPDFAPNAVADRF